MTKLKCVGRYRNDRLSIAYAVGDVFEVDGARLTYLMSDAPGCFEVVTEPTKAVSKPAQNKMVTGAENK